MNTTVYYLVALIVFMIWAAVTCIIASRSYYNGFEEGFEAGKKAKHGENT